MQTDRFPKMFTTSCSDYLLLIIAKKRYGLVPSLHSISNSIGQVLFRRADIRELIINRHALLMFRRQGLSSNLHYGKNFSGQPWITIYLKLIYSHFISWSKATLKPISIFVTRGAQYNLAAQRQLSLSIVKSPPRTTLSVPVFGPVGFQANPPEPP